MRIEIRFHNLQRSESLVEWAERRARRLARRFGRELHTLELRISDTNGPNRGGVDKRCHAIASGPRLGVVQVLETHEDPYACVEFAIYRLARSVERGLARAGAGDAATIRRPPLAATGRGW